MELDHSRNFDENALHPILCQLEDSDGQAHGENGRHLTIWDVVVKSHNCSKLWTLATLNPTGFNVRQARVIWSSWIFLCKHFVLLVLFLLIKVTDSQGAGGSWVDHFTGFINCGCCCYVVVMLLCETVGLASFFLLLSSLSLWCSV